jgi:hypothetical protein
VPWLDIKLDEAKLAEAQKAVAGIQQGLGRGRAGGRENIPGGYRGGTGTLPEDAARRL